MKLTFANGTDEQKGHWQAAIERLMNLPRDALPLEVEITFEDPSKVVNKGHKDLAITSWTYGSISSKTVVRNDAPNFGDQRLSLEAEAAAAGVPFNSAKFYSETSGHELGHSAFAALPEPNRIAIAQLFGAESDDIAELSPPGADWEDKIIEGIAETFKEAFMPRRFRVFGNRTNRRIPYSKFPEFRRLFREGIEESGGEVGVGETEVPKYDFDVALSGGVRNQASHLVGEGEMDVIPGDGGFSQTFSSIAPDYAGLAVQIGLESFLNMRGVWLPHGTVLNFPITIPAEVLDPASFNAPGKATEIWLIFWQNKLEGGGGTKFLLSLEINHFPTAKGGPGDPIYTVRHNPGGLEEKFESEVFPPYDINVELVVDSFFPTTAKCEGVTYRKVFFEGFYVIDTAKTMKEGPGITHTELRKNVVLPWLPSWPLKTSRCPQTAGEPIDIPQGLILPGDYRTGVHPSLHPVVR